mgnify:CR=1 FL=1
MSASAHRLGVGALAVAGFFFGVTFLVVQDAVDRADVYAFLGVRFLIGAAVLAPMAFRRPATPGEVRHGILAGACLLVGYVVQTFGLRHTTAASSAFITYLLVVFVPLVVAVRTRRLPSGQVLAGVGLAVAGLYALSDGIGGLGRGEALTLVCALMFALHIIVLGEVSGRHDAFRLTFWQLVTVGVACLVPGALAGDGVGSAFAFDRGVWIAAIFCGIGPTAISFWCMSWGQKVVPESQAAIILLLEPVSAAALGELTGEHLGWRGGLGALLILGAVVVTEILGRARPAALGAEVAVIPDPDPDLSDLDPGLSDPGPPTVGPAGRAGLSPGAGDPRR